MLLLPKSAHLIILKVLSRSEVRLQDSIDLQHLLIVADEQERTRAREAVTLIMQRGYNRGKDLVSELEMLLERHPFTS
jgi:hypothetical protein